MIRITPTCKLANIVPAKYLHFINCGIIRDFPEEGRGTTQAPRRGVWHYASTQKRGVALLEHGTAILNSLCFESEALCKMWRMGARPPR